MEARNDSTCQKCFKALIALTLFGVFCTVISERSFIYDKIGLFIGWMSEHKVLGPLILCFAVMLGEVFFLPGSMLCIGAGFAFKRAYGELRFAMVVGSTACVIGASVGAILTMLLGRYVFRNAAENLYRKYPVLHALNKAIESEGLYLIFLLRLCPLVPFTLFNFIIGITDMKFFDYCLGMLAIIPITILYVFMGTTLSDIT